LLQINLENEPNQLLAEPIKSSNQSE